MNFTRSTIRWGARCTVCEQSYLHPANRCLRWGGSLILITTGFELDTSGIVEKPFAKKNIDIRGFNKAIDVRNSRKEVVLPRTSAKNHGSVRIFLKKETSEPCVLKSMRPRKKKGDVEKIATHEMSEVWKSPLKSALPSSRWNLRRRQLAWMYAAISALWTPQFEWHASTPLSWWPSRHSRWAMWRILVPKTTPTC